MNADTVDLLEQFIALHQFSRDPHIVERVAYARATVIEYDANRAREVIEREMIEHFRA